MTKNNNNGSVSWFRKRFDANKPWLNDPNWVGAQRAWAERYADRADDDGRITKHEAQRSQRLKNRAVGARRAYRAYQNAQAPGDDPAVPPGDPVDPGAAAAQQSAYDQMFMLLEEYGLGSLGPVLQGLIADGITDQASLTLALQNTQEWKTRFAGNEMLKQNGLPVLSVGEYLAVERSYAQILKNYGLPTGFYDDPSDFAKWIGNSVSANELQQRASMFADVAKREDPAVTDQLASMGLSQGDIMAYIMDPTRAQPLIQRKVETMKLGTAARHAGIVANNDYLGHLSDIGVSEQQAAQGYGVISEGLGTMQTLGDVYGEHFGQADFEHEVFEQDGDAAKKRKRLASRERANFAGQSGIGQASLTRPTGGSY